MKALLLAVLALPALSAEPKEASVSKPPLEFAGVARFQHLEGWTVRRTEGADPSLRLSLGENVIKARLFGGKASRYGKPQDYLKGFEATTMGNPPERIREAAVAGLRVWVYRHGYPLAQGDPGAMDPRPPQLAAEEFCILPVRKGFLVLSWAYEAAVPELEPVGKPAWQAFLASAVLVKR